METDVAYDVGLPPKCLVPLDCIRDGTRVSADQKIASVIVFFNFFTDEAQHEARRNFTVLFSALFYDLSLWGVDFGGSFVNEFVGRIKIEPVFPD